MRREARSNPFRHSRIAGVQSISTAPSSSPDSSPDGPSSSASTSADVERQVTMNSAPVAASAGVVAWRAPVLAAKSAAFCPVRFQTASEKEFFS